MEHKKYKVSVVILNWNGEDHLKNFLPGVVKYSTFPDIDIVIADNGSTDASIKYIKDKVILDFGCGDGYAAAKFFNMGAKSVHAFDIMYPPPDDLYQNRQVKYLNDYPIGIYDIIWLHHVLEHIPDPVNMLLSLNALLHSYGELWVTVPNMANSAIYSDVHINNYNLYTLLLSLLLANFSIFNIHWLMSPGQLRIRVRKMGNKEWPIPFQYKMQGGRHFNIGELPATWRWKNNEE